MRSHKTRRALSVTSDFSCHNVRTNPGTDRKQKAATRSTAFGNVSGDAAAVTQTDNAYLV